MPDDPIMHVELAEALFMAAGQSFDPDSVGALDKALEIEPRLPKALFYRGLAHRQAGDNRAAVQDWTNLVAVSPPDAPYLISVRGQIAAAAKEGNIDLSTIRPRFTSTKGPTAEELEAASQMSVDERQAFIRSMVTRLTTRLQEEPGDAAGWRRLARAYQVLGEPKKAADAEARARQAELGGVEGERPAGPGKKTPGNRPWN
ncbi:MAG: hypothetical protein VYE18_08355 [Pseudomonadota bacterium]|nr:hypothetical protein [Pseudomonadota bacterium]